MLYIFNGTWGWWLSSWLAHMFGATSPHQPGLNRLGVHPPVAATSTACQSPRHFSTSASRTSRASGTVHRRPQAFRGCRSCPRFWEAEGLLKSMTSNPELAGSTFLMLFFEGSWNPWAGHYLWNQAREPMTYSAGLATSKDENVIDYVNVWTSLNVVRFRAWDILGRRWTHGATLFRSCLRRWLDQVWLRKLHLLEDKLLSVRPAAGCRTCRKNPFADDDLWMFVVDNGQ